MAELQKLKASVYRATEPSGSDGEGDPTAMVEINIILQEHPNLMVEAVKAIKARCKDKNESVQVIALDLLDQCMQSNGIQLQMHVMKKVLPRVLKFANPSKRECGRLCEQKSAALIKSWATLYGGDGRMKDFENAAKDLARAEEKLQLQVTTRNIEHVLSLTLLPSFVYLSLPPPFLRSSLNPLPLLSLSLFLALCPPHLPSSLPPSGESLACVCALPRSLSRDIFGRLTVTPRVKQRAAAARMAASQRSAGGSVDDTMFPRLGNQANADRARDLQSGIPPMRYGSPPAPSGLAFDDGFSGGQGMPTVDVDQARESLELMTMMMQVRCLCDMGMCLCDAYRIPLRKGKRFALMMRMMQDRDTDLRHNEVLAEVAMLCKGCRAAIQQQIAGVQDESKLVAMLKLNDDLSDQLDAYEQVLRCSYCARRNPTMDTQFEACACQWHANETMLTNHV